MLNNAGISFQNISPDIDEEAFIDKSEKPETIAMNLAYAKAEIIAADFSNCLILGADTLVAYDNKIMGKPTDIEEAKYFLKLLSGQIHQVITGYSLIHKQRNYAFTDFSVTNVQIESITEKDIDEYVNSENILDAAGAYKIQGSFSKFITKIDGCYFNVVGLPVSKIYKTISLFYTNHL